jgi:glycosyltransferase involved in cell wall biosynthesis
LVYTPHYVAFAAGIPRAQRRVALYLEKLLAPQTAHFIAVSQHEESVLRRVLKIEASRASVIYNGVDDEAQEAENRPTETFVIGCFGRLTMQKNQGLLIRALPLVLKEVPEARLKLVGSGENGSTLRALAMRLNCDNRVDFTGEISDPYAEYSGCDLIAQPSRWEGCSYAILEAMSARRAIVASTAGGTPEVVGNAGVLLPAHDERVWAKQIIALARDAKRREILGARARQRVRKYFGLEEMVEKTLAIYRATR